MKKRFRTLIIIPKQAATIVAVYLEDVCILNESIPYIHAENRSMEEEVKIRQDMIVQLLIDVGINLSKLDAITSIGGLIRPVEGGTYVINQKMYDDLTANYNGKHVSNLGGIIAYHMASNLNIKSYIVDPPVVDELTEVATVSGVSSIRRKSVFHALNQKAVARITAKKLNKSYNQANFIVAHIGNGITVGAHKNGQVIDVNNGLHGEGPFSFERAGSIAIEAIIDKMNGEFQEMDSFIEQMTFHSGLKSYLNITTIEELEDKLDEKDEDALFFVEAMGYQIAKEIGAMSTVLEGQVDSVILTGELTESSLLVNYISMKVDWIGDIFVYPGEEEVAALHAGTLRILHEIEKEKHYS